MVAPRPIRAPRPGKGGLGRIRSPGQSIRTCDPELENWTDAYCGPNYDRLIPIKAQYNASNLFHSSQSLPVLP